MILTDYFKSQQDTSWDIAKQAGVEYGVIRLPETPDFDITNPAHWRDVHKRFIDFGIKPIIIEPMPNLVHEHIKVGDAERDKCIEKVLKIFPIMKELGIETICFNWMAHIGWLRTAYDIPARGGATVTGFKMADFVETDDAITTEELWENYAYFLKAVIPDAEKYGIKLALHPDDPPVPRLGNVHRIMISAENIRKAIYDIYPSDCLGLTMCQANFYIMGEDLEKIIADFAQKIFFVHFRNTVGHLEEFRESFHDNGELAMAKLLQCYADFGVDVPIRVDHVPTLKGEHAELPGYAALGRLFAIGYLKGLLEKIK